MEQQPPYSYVSEPYSPNHYQAIRNSLYAATQAFKERNAQELINTEIRDCFLRHGVENDFSACLIHRHFDILPSERNVESGGKAVAASDLDNMYPSSWMFCRDSSDSSRSKLYPYEYKRAQTVCPPADFVREYGDILTRTGYEDLIGFQAYENGVVGFESTDRETNVSTTVEKAEHEVTEGDLAPMAPASWAFFKY